MKSFTAAILCGLASAQDLWEDLKAEADFYFGNADGDLTFEELTAGIEEMGGMDQETLLEWYGEDYDWESDAWFLTDFISNEFDENYDGLCADECMDFADHLGFDLTEEDIKKAFDHHDMNDDGLLSIWEQDEIWHDLKNGSGLFHEEGEDHTDVYEWTEDGELDWDSIYDWYYDDWYGEYGEDWLDEYYELWDDYYELWEDYYEIWEEYYESGDWEGLQEDLEEHWDDYFDWLDDYYDWLDDWYYDDWYYDDWYGDDWLDDWYYDDWYYDDWYGDDWYFDDWYGEYGDDYYWDDYYWDDYYWDDWYGEYGDDWYSDDWWY